MSICFHKEIHSGGHYISHFIDKQVTSVKVDLSPKVSFGIKLLSNMNRILMRVFEKFQGALNTCFHKEVPSGGHYISCFTDKQVTNSVKVALSPKVSFGTMLLSNMN